MHNDQHVPSKARRAKRAKELNAHNNVFHDVPSKIINSRALLDTLPLSREVQTYPQRHTKRMKQKRTNRLSPVPSGHIVVWLSVCHHVMHCSFTICARCSTRTGHIDEQRKPGDIQNPETLPICDLRQLPPKP